MVVLKVLRLLLGAAQEDHSCCQSHCAGSTSLIWRRAAGSGRASRLGVTGMNEIGESSRLPDSEIFGSHSKERRATCAI